MCVILILFHTASRMGLIFKYCRKKNKKPNLDVEAQPYGSSTWDNRGFEKSGGTTGTVSAASSRPTTPGVAQLGRTPLRSSLKKNRSSRTESENSRSGYVSESSTTNTSSCDEADIVSGELSANNSKGHVRFNDNLPTLSGDLPPDDGRKNKPHPHLANQKYRKPPPKPQGLSWYPNFGKKKRKTSSSKTLPTTTAPSANAKRPRHQYSFEGRPPGSHGTYRPPMTGSQQETPKMKSLSVSELPTAVQPSPMMRTALAASDSNVPMGYSNTAFRQSEVMDSSSSSLEGNIVDGNIQHNSNLRRSRRPRSKRTLKSSEDAPNQSVRGKNAPAALPALNGSDQHIPPLAQSSPQDNRYMDMSAAAPAGLPAQQFFRPLQSYIPTQPQAISVEENAPKAAGRSGKPKSKSPRPKTRSGVQETGNNMDDLRNSGDSNYYSASPSSDDVPRVKISMNPGGSDPSARKKKKRNANSIPRDVPVASMQTSVHEQHANLAYIDDEAEHAPPPSRNRKVRASRVVNTSFANPDSSETEV